MDGDKLMLEEITFVLVVCQQVLDILIAITHAKLEDRNSLIEEMVMNIIPMLKRRDKLILLVVKRRILR